MRQNYVGVQCNIELLDSEMRDAFPDSFAGLEYRSGFLALVFYVDVDRLAVDAVVQAHDPQSRTEGQRTVDQLLALSDAEFVAWFVALDNASQRNVVAKALARLRHLLVRGVE